MNNFRPIIRSATLSDAAVINTYTRTVAAESHFLSFGAEEYTNDIEQTKQFIKDHIEADNRLILVAYFKKELISLLTIKANQKTRLRHNGELGLTVLKAQWGKGVGKAMMDKMFEWANDNTVIKKINLTVLESNHRAIDMYKKYGFEQEGLIRNDFFFDGDYLNAIIMGKWLG